MNFVGLVGQLQQEVGVIGAAPTTLAGQVAEVNRLAGWVNAAWLDIQQAHEDWFFLRAKFSFATQPQVWTYGESQVGIGAPGLGRYKLDSLRLYNPALGVASEMRLPHLDYDRFLGQFQLGTMRNTATRPTVFSVDPQRNLVLGAVPDAVYTVNGEYFAAPAPLVADTDVPSLPARFHMAIVYRAMTHYGLYEAASEVLNRGQAEFQKLMRRVEADQLPSLRLGPPLC